MTEASNLDSTPTPSPTPTPTPSLTGREPGVIDQAASAPNWIDSLPQELRGEAALANFRSIDELARGYVETKKLASSKVTLPRADDPESFTRFAAAVRPESADAYDFNLPEGEQSPFADFMRPKLHEAGLHPRQAAILIEANNAYARQQQEAAEQAGRDELDALAAEIGGNQFERSKQAAAKMLDKLGVPISFETDLARFVGAGNTLRLLFDIAERNGELGKVDYRDVDLALGNLKGDAARAEAEKMIRNDKDGNLRNPDHPDRKRYDKLVEAARIRA